MWTGTVNLDDHSLEVESFVEFTDADTGNKICFRRFVVTGEREEEA